MRIAPITVGLLTGLCLFYQANELITQKKSFDTTYDNPIHYGRDSEAKIAVVSYIDRMTRTRRGDASEEIKRPDIGAQYLKSISNVRSNARKRELLDWKERGPGNVPGRAKAFLVDQNDDTNFSWIVGTAGGGIWKTSNQGVKWINVTEGVPNLSIVCLAQNDQSPQIIYAGTGENAYSGSLHNGSGILKSTDGGDTWALIPSTIKSASEDFSNVNRIVIDPTDANVIFASTSINFRAEGPHGAVMKSTDGGDSWTKIYESTNLAHQLSADPNNFETLYLSVFQEGIVKSTDGGATWNATGIGAVASAFSPGRFEFAIAPSNSNSLFASVAYGGVTTSGSGLFYSADAGDTWTLVRDGSVVGDTDYLVQGNYDNCIAIYPDNDKKIIWGGTNLWTGVVESDTKINGKKTFLGADDSETKWFLDLVNFNNGTHYGNKLAIKNSLETPSLEIRFGTNKKQMAHRFTVPAGENAGVPDADYSYQNYVEVPFEVWDTENNKQLMVSFRDQEQDGGFTLNFPADEDLSNSREYIFVHSIAYNASSPSSTITKSGGHEESQYLFMWPKLVLDSDFNAGNIADATFSVTFGEVDFYNMSVSNVSESNEDMHPDHHSLSIFDIDGVSRVVSTNDGGVAVSIDDGQTFGSRSKGMSTTQFYNVSKKPGSASYLGGTQDNGVVYSSDDPEASSSYLYQPNGGDGLDVLWHGNDANVMLIAIYQNILHKTTDGGATWEDSTNGLVDSGNNSSEAPFFSKFGNSRNNSNFVFAVSDRGVWKSTNFGSLWNWKELKASDGWGGFLDVEVSDADPSIVWAGGAMDNDRTLFVSTDFGDTFKPVKNYDLLPDAGNITTIVPDPNDAQTVYVTMSRTGEPKILRSKNLGETWEDISGFGVNSESSNGFPDISTYDLLIFPDGMTIWAGTELGLYESTDNGESWHYADNGLPFVMIQDIKVQEGEVVVGTYGRGIWSVDLGLAYEGQKVILSADNFDPEVNVYPNPASDYLNINIDNSYVQSIEIRNIQGALVHTEVAASAWKSKRIETNHLDRGMYLLTLVDGQGRSNVSKFIID
ncbi:MAG: T9SS type A sorting domain-containing protein [Reichenbachiella sp.]|uniref:T9SS type A sorting domain-containing protein n=1 Tax=Reichenbachiella sp. TaxID=2184521 RepID=UPI0032632152